MSAHEPSESDEHPVGVIVPWIGRQGEGPHNMHSNKSDNGDVDSCSGRGEKWGGGGAAAAVVT